MDLYKEATRLKLRFPTPKGNITLEDVWDLPLTSKTGKNANLNDLAKTLNRELKNDDDEDFVRRRLRPNAELTMKFEIVKDVIAVRLAESDAAEAAKVAKEKKAQIMALIVEKETEALKGKSLEDLRALLDSL